LKSLFKKSNDARIIELFWLLKHVMLLKKHVKWYSAKTVMGGGGLPGNYLIQAECLQNAEYILVEEIRLEEQLNKVVTEHFKHFTVTW
jgi:hypothetical protein